MEANQRVSQILQRKGHNVWTVEPEATVFDALERMADKDVGALIVTADGRVVGIFSERDYARKIILMGKASKETRVSEIMTPDVVSIGPNQTLQECMSLMTERRIRHLPVLQEDRLVGLISIGDVVKAVIAEQSFLIEQLQSYISGST